MYLYRRIAVTTITARSSEIIKMFVADNFITRPDICLPTKLNK